MVDKDNIYVLKKTIENFKLYILLTVDNENFDSDF